MMIAKPDGWRLLRLAALAILLLPRSAGAAPQVIGWVEEVAVGDGSLVLQAKIDTGADVSSIDVDELQLVRRDRRTYALFTVGAPDGPHRFERQVVRTATIKSIAGGTQSRPTVRLDLCLGNVRREVDVNLVDREGMQYAMLVGRNFLAGHFAVDSARALTVPPRCGKAGG